MTTDENTDPNKPGMMPQSVKGRDSMSVPLDLKMLREQLARSQVRFCYYQRELLWGRRTRNQIEEHVSKKTEDE